MVKLGKLSLIFLCVCVQSVKAVRAEQDELIRVKHNYKAMLVPMEGYSSELLSVLETIPPEEELSDQVVSELHQRYPFDLEKIDAYLALMNDDGSWADINYDDNKRSGWDPKRHAERILELVKLYCSDTTGYYQSAKIESYIHRALNYWFTAKPICLNWWYNQIGIPKTLGTAFILFEEKLTGEEHRSAIQVMENAKFGMTGQNKVWLAGNVMMRALLQNDYELVKTARDTIVSEITTTGAEGIKSDWSFHQHGAQQQFGNYGLSFVSGMSFFSGVLAGTSLAFDENHIGILTKLILYAYRWTLWQGMMDISALGRQLFHNAPLHKGLALLFAASELGGGKFNKDDVITRNILPGNLPNGPNRFVGHIHFWESDYTIYRRNLWMASVKMASERVIGAESLNGDNMKGYYMADGATYVYGMNKKYLNIFPFWDWRKIPGVTAYESEAPMPVLKKYEPRNRASFVGGVTDGYRGITAMELNRDGLKARKAWIFIDGWPSEEGEADCIVCLGTDIASDSILHVTTSIEQCYPQGDLLYLENGQWRKVSGMRNYTANEQRFTHGDMGYIIWGESKYVQSVAGTEKRAGRWHDIMQMYRPRELESDVVSLYLKHGVSPTNGKYQYIILPCGNKDVTADFDLSSVRVLRNDEAAQAVSKHDFCWIAAYQPVVLNTGEINIDIKTPGLYMIRKDSGHYRVLYSDPTQQLNTVEITINDTSVKIAGNNTFTGESICISAR